MKNLKKLLAMVLAVVLAFGIMTTAAAANVADYPDADDVTYTEAVDLFTALGFLQGRDTGDFDPQGLVTREEAAKIITYMLIGSAKADALTTATTSFTDVDAGRWSAAFIEYCTALGIINGKGDGTFDPAGNVTGIEFAKMLLCAVGFGVNDEYTGANWAMKTIADATSLGILSLDVDFSAAATREECSQYGFNMYTKVNAVVWNSTTMAYQQATNIDGVDAKGTLATQQSVSKTASTYTANGTTYYKWTKYGVELTGGYTKEKVIGSSMDGTTIAVLTDSSSSKYIGSFDTDATIYVNGTAYKAIANGGTTTANQVYYNTSVDAWKTAVATAAASTDGAATPTNSTIVKGTVVTFVNTDADSKAEVVRIINKTAAYLSSAPMVNTTNNTVTVAGVTGLTSVNTGKVEGYSDLASGDVVLWYKDNSGVYHLEKATSVTGNAGTIMSGVYVDVDSAKYFYSGLTTPSFTIADTWLNSDCTIWLDDGGYIVYAKTASTSVTNPASAYLFVTAHETNATLGGTVASAVFSDGTKSNITLASNSALYGVATSTTTNTFYKFSVNSAGAYVLTAVVNNIAAAMGSEAQTTINTYEQNNYAFAAAAHDPTITQAVASYLTDTIGSLKSKNTANSSTHFVYQSTADKLYAYTGIANTPTFTTNAANDVVYTLSKVTTAGTEGTAIFVYAIDAATASFTTGSTTGTWTYVASTTYSTSVDTKGNTIHTYQAFSNDALGTIQVLATSDFVTRVGLYQVTGHDANGYANAALLSTETTSNTSPATYNYANVSGGVYTTVSSSGGNITVANTDFPFGVSRALNSSAKIWFIDTTNATTTGTIAYEISASQLNALAGTTGYSVALVNASTTDTSVGTVYVMGSLT